ncbi:MAG: hypothetical protein ACOX56_03740 [Acholeplasmataceae bacterium]
MKIINYIIRVTSVLSIVGAILLYVLHGKSEGQILGRTFPVIFSSIIIFIVTFLPNMLLKKNIEIPKLTYGILLGTIILSMGGGYVLMLYHRLNYFDTFVHFINGIILVLGFFVVVYYFVKDPKEHIFAIILLSVLAAISLGTIWEIFEFVVDLIVPGSNMQRFQDLKTGENLVGQAALMDTMIDIVVDTLGAILGGLILRIDYLRRHILIDSIVLRKIE